MNQQEQIVYNVKALSHNDRALRAYQLGIDVRLRELVQVLHEQQIITQQHIDRIDAAATEAKNEAGAKLGINMNPPLDQTLR